MIAISCNKYPSYILTPARALILRNTLPAQWLRIAHCRHAVAARIAHQPPRMQSAQPTDDTRGDPQESGWVSPIPAALGCPKNRGTFLEALGEESDLWDVL